ncbi:hypothetical protein D3C73_1226400 [compost metagenome]
MKLIDNSIDRIGQRRLLFSPAAGIGLAHIENGTPVPIHTNRPGVRVCCLVPPLPDAYPVGVEFAVQIAGGFQPPRPPDIADHRQALTFSILPGSIEYNLGFQRRWCPQAERRMKRSIA